MEVKIKIKIKDVEIELKRGEVEELRNILNGLAGKEKEYVPYPVTYPAYPYPHRPLSPQYGEYWDVTWYGTSDNVSPAEMAICLS